MIYFDNNATTMIAPGVVECMMPFLTGSYGNPASAHNHGADAKLAVDDARAGLAELIGAASLGEIAFTSGGTESDNWAITGSLTTDKNHIITTRVEHEAVRKQCEKLETTGVRVTWLDVDGTGALDLDGLRDSLNENTALVSVMMANNETGVLFDVDQIGQIVKERSNALFHVDGVNAVGKVLIDLKKTVIDLFSLSGHKFHGPKGIGALYIHNGVTLPSFLTGGGQENGRRAGTEAVHQIVGIGAAARFVKDTSPMPKIRAMRDRLENEILNCIPNSRVNGTRDAAKRLPNTLNISFENTNGEAILAKLNDQGICVSTGSACNSQDHTASAVLQAMDVPYSWAMGSIRFSLGRYNTEAEVDLVIDKLPKIVDELRAIAA